VTADEIVSIHIELDGGLANALDVAKAIGVNDFTMEVDRTDDFRTKFAFDVKFQQEVYGCWRMMSKLFPFKMDAYEVARLVSKLT
jgi:hypothetical protein